MGVRARGARTIDHLAHVTSDAAALATAVADAPTAPVACYQGWTLVELGGHVGQIHRWVTGVVEDRARERPSGDHAAAPDVAALPDWIIAGAARLVEVLAAADPSDEVWTISRTDRNVAFWRRRMALETALHRWDAEDALGQSAVVEESLALEGVDETLHLYLEQRLDGHEVDGAGERVAFVPAGSGGWTMTLRETGIEVAPGHADADATVSGSALDLWLLLTCRAGLDEVELEGDAAAAAHAVRVTTWVPGPAG